MEFNSPWRRIEERMRSLGMIFSVMIMIFLGLTVGPSNKVAAAEGEPSVVEPVPATSAAPNCSLSGRYAGEDYNNAEFEYMTYQGQTEYPGPGWDIYNSETVAGLSITVQVGNSSLKPEFLNSVRQVQVNIGGYFGDNTVNINYSQLQQPIVIDTARIISAFSDAPNISENYGILTIQCEPGAE